ncbi:MAG: family peptidase [Acidimicrobiaceae bacterium]|jgi:dipeptidyl aminopeptidase/acylaminoacyl peptidase|nr:family peptidase [Acidimicrobiaceae bacterium]
MVELIPRTVLFGNPERLGPRLSPDGKQLAWLAPAEGVLNVWVAPAADEQTVAPVGGVAEASHEATSAVDWAAARVVTDDHDRGVRTFTWAHDGRHILYLQDRGGDENWRLYDVDLPTMARRDLTPFDNVQVQLIAVDKRFPTDVLVGINLDNPELHDVYHLDLVSGQVRKTVTNPGFVGWLADAEMEVRAAVAPQPDGGFVLMVRDEPAQDWRPLMTVSDEDALTTGPVSFSVEGSSLLALSSVGSETAHLVRINLADGTTEELAADPAADITDIRLDPDTWEPQMATVLKDRAELIVLDPALTEDLEVVRSLHPGDPSIGGGDDRDASWLVAFNQDAGPISYFAYERGSRRGRFLFDHQPALSRYTLASMEPFSFQSRDGLTIHGYLTFPPGLERTELPTVLFVHGGPWARDAWGYDPNAQWLANRGYLCLQVNFRGSTGYGKSFVNAGNKEWGGRMHDDLVDARSFVVDQGWADALRIGICGGSYGGYAALVGASFTPDLFRCAVDIVGPSNLITLIESIPPYWAPEIEIFHRRVGNPETEKDFLWSRSPLSRVRDIRIPLLIAQGANDPRVKQAEAEQIVAALREAGVEHEYLLFPDEGHGFAKPENRLRFYAAAEAFLARHLGGRIEQ